MKKLTKTILKRTIWLGRGTATVMGLVVMLALVVGVASTALGANGGNFILGKNNAATALTRLTGNVNGSAMQIVNNTNAGANDSALTLSVQKGEAPMRVSSDAKVPNLNADKLDGRDSADFLSEGRVYQAFDSEQGEGGGDFFVGIASCDIGDPVLGGGMNGNFFGQDDLLSSGPSTNAWVLRARDNGSSDNFNVVAICADFPPLRP